MAVTFNPVDTKRTPARAQSNADGLADAYFMAEIARIPRLSHEEQIELARAVVAGRSATARLRESALSDEERRGVEETVERGKVARGRLFEGTLRLALFVARQYGNRGLPVADLAQEASLGILAAIDRFDPDRGVHFSTYAYWWIRQAVTRAIADRGRLIRLPVHVGELLRRVERARGEAGDRLTSEELAAKVGTRPGRLQEVLRGARVPISLDRQADGEEGEDLGARYADAGAPDPAQTVADRAAKAVVLRALSAIPHRDKCVLERAFGLNGHRTAKLTEIARDLGLSRERVRQIERKALARLACREEVRELRESA